MLYFAPLTSISLLLSVAQAAPSTSVDLGSRGYGNDRLARRMYHPSAHRSLNPNPVGPHSPVSQSPGSQSPGSPSPGPAQPAPAYYPAPAEHDPAALRALARLNAAYIGSPASSPQRPSSPHGSSSQTPQQHEDPFAFFTTLGDSPQSPGMPRFWTPDTGAPEPTHQRSAQQNPGHQARAHQTPEHQDPGHGTPAHQVPEQEHQTPGRQHQQNPQSPSSLQTPPSLHGEKRKAPSSPEPLPPASKPKYEDMEITWLVGPDNTRYDDLRWRPICHNNDIGGKCQENCECRFYPNADLPNKCGSKGEKGTKKRRKERELCVEKDKAKGGGCQCPRAEKTKRICPATRDKTAKDHSLAVACSKECKCVTQPSPHMPMENCAKSEDAKSSPLFLLIAAERDAILSADWYKTWAAADGIEGKQDVGEIPDWAVRRQADLRCSELCSCGWEITGMIPPFKYVPFTKGGGSAQASAPP